MSWKSLRDEIKTDTTIPWIEKGYCTTKTIIKEMGLSERQAFIVLGKAVKQKKVKKVACLKDGCRVTLYKLL